MKKASKILLKALYSIAVVVFVYVYLCLIFMPKDLNDRGSNQYYRTMSISKEDKNTLDIIMYGNSDLSSAIIPLQIYKDTGITSYMNWNDQETTKSIVKHLKRDLKNQSPQMVILETDCFYYENSLNTVSYNFTQSLFAPFVYHTRWKELELKDFYPSFNFKQNELKGHYFKKDIYECNPNNYMKPTDEIEKIQESVIKDVNKIKEICDKNGITLLFVESPSPSSWNMKRYNGVKKLADKLNIPFIDFNIEIENYEVDFSKDFRDNGNHLNFGGATKVTTYLSNYLTNKYKFKDKRGIKNYQSWDSLIERYDEIYEL